MSQQLPIAVTGVIQGMLLFFLLAMDVFIFYRVRYVPAVRAVPDAPAREATGNA
jgi:ABC-type uncharacterized transport system permease subunit